MLPERWLNPNQIQKVIFFFFFFREHLHRMAVYKHREHCGVNLLQSKTAALATETLFPQKLYGKRTFHLVRVAERGVSVPSRLLCAVSSSGRSEVKRNHHPSRSRSAHNPHRNGFYCVKMALDAETRHTNLTRGVFNSSEDDPVSRSLI